LRLLSLLILSHSPDVAKGVKEMCEQMAPEGVLIEAIGGTRDGRLGIDAEMVFIKLGELVSKTDGVVILGDIGSTIMAAKQSIELLGSPSKVIIADAPLVEGSIIATVEASLGSSIEDVKKRAEEVKFTSKL